MLRRFNQYCVKQAATEAREIEKIVNKEIEEQVSFALADYEKEKKKECAKKITQIERDYHQMIWEIERNAKKAILEKKQEVINQVREGLTQKLSAFIDSRAYKEYFFLWLAQAMEKIPQEEKTIVYVRLRDKKRYGTMIRKQYPQVIKVEEMEEEKLGGCICKSEQVFIDDTIEAKIQKSLKLE